MADNDEKKLEPPPTPAATKENSDPPSDDDDANSTRPGEYRRSISENIPAPTDAVARSVAASRAVAESVGAPITALSGSSASNSRAADVPPAAPATRALRMHAERGDFGMEGSPARLTSTKLDAGSSGSEVPPIGAGGAATVTNPPLTGLGRAALPPIGASGTATVTPPPVSASLNVQLAPVTLSATGVVRNVPNVAPTLSTESEEVLVTESGEALLTQTGEEPADVEPPPPLGKPSTDPAPGPPSQGADGAVGPGTSPPLAPGNRAEVGGRDVPPRPATQTISPSGIPSEAAVGTPALQLLSDKAPDVIATGATVGALEGTASIHFTAQGTLTATRVGPRSESVNDQPNDEDHIGFKPYVDALAQFLMNKRTLPPLTVSLEGEWGAGKSSFMAQLQTALTRGVPRPSGSATGHVKRTARELWRSLKRRLHGRRGPKSPKAHPLDQMPHIVRFNAWRHDKDEAVWASFALKFARDLAPVKAWRRVYLAVSLARRRMNWVAAVPLIVRVTLICLLGFILLVAVGRFLFFPTLHSDGELSVLADWVDYAKRWWSAALITPAVLAVRGILRPIVASPLEFDVKKYVSAPEYKDKVSFLERFQEDFTRFVETYSEGRRIFVLVDDLDRCDVAKAADLLQALHLMLPFDAPIFLIVALDRKKIAMGIAVRGKELLPFVTGSTAHDAAMTRPNADDTTESAETANALAGLTYGYEFIEKFIQLPFRVPMLTETGLRPFLDSLLGTASTARGSGIAPRPAVLEEIVEHDGPDVRRVMEMVAPALGHNPRRMKQFLNLFRLRHYIAQKTGQLRVDGLGLGLTLPQLGKIVAIELRWPLVLDRLLRDADALNAFVSKEAPLSLSRWAPDAALTALRDHLPDESPRDYTLNLGLLHHLPALYGTAPHESAATTNESSATGVAT